MTYITSYSAEPVENLQSDFGIMEEMARIITAKDPFVNAIMRHRKAMEGAQHVAKCSNDYLVLGKKESE